MINPLVASISKRKVYNLFFVEQIIHLAGELDNGTEMLFHCCWIGFYGWFMATKVCENKISSKASNSHPFMFLKKRSGIDGKRVSARNCCRYMVTTQLACSRSPFDVLQHMGHTTLTLFHTDRFNRGNNIAFGVVWVNEIWSQKHKWLNHKSLSK